MYILKFFNLFLFFLIKHSNKYKFSLLLNLHSINLIVVISSSLFFNKFSIINLVTFSSFLKLSNFIFISSSERLLFIFPKNSRKIDNKSSFKYLIKNDKEVN